MRVVARNERAVVSVYSPARYVELRSQQNNGITSYGMCRRAHQILDHLRSQKVSPGRVLDIGTADGQMLPVLKPSLSPRLWVGVDCNPGMMDVSRFPDDWWGGFVRADGRKLPFGDAMFDLVIAAAIVKHVRHAERLFAEARRVLQDGGWFFVSDPTPLAIWLGVKMGHFEEQWLANRWSISDWRREIEPAGFRLQRAERYILLPRRVSGLERLERFLSPTLLNRLFLHQAATFEAIGC